MAMYRAVEHRIDGVDVVTIEDGEGAVAEIVPSLGNTCWRFECDGPVLEAVERPAFLAKPTACGIPLLFPFPNRVRDGRFEFEGREVVVNPPRHGFVRDRAWKVENVTATSLDGVTVRSVFDAADHPDILAQWPSSFRLAAAYRLFERTLTLTFEIENTGDRAFPYGYGIHPYFERPARGVVRVPASERWMLDDSLPTGERVEVSGGYDLRAGADVLEVQLDDILTGLDADERGEVRCEIDDLETEWRTTVRFERAAFPHVVVYTPPAPRTAICVEPNTCPTDAFNLSSRGIDANVLVLGPGQSARFEVHIERSRIE